MEVVLMLTVDALEGDEREVASRVVDLVEGISAVRSVVPLGAFERDLDLDLARARVIVGYRSSEDAQVAAVFTELQRRRREARSDAGWDS